MWAQQHRGREKLETSVRPVCWSEENGSPTSITQGYICCTNNVTLASEFGRALSAHCVGAWGRLLEILRSESLPDRGVMLHSYVAPIEMLDDFVAIDAVHFSLCFASPKPPSRELVLRLPQDRVLIESDSTAANGRQPSGVITGHEKLAEIHGEPTQQIATRVAANFARLFSPPAEK